VRFWRHPARCTALPVIQPTPRPARPARRSRLCPHWLLGQRSMCKGLPNGYTFSGASISARRIFTCSLLLHNAAWIAGWNCAAHRRPCRWQPQFCGMTVPDCFLYMGRYVNLDFLSLTDHKKKTVRNSHFCQIARLQLWPSSLQPRRISRLAQYQRRPPPKDKRGIFSIARIRSCAGTFVKSP